MIFLSCSNHHHPAGLYIGRVYYVSCTVDTGVGGGTSVDRFLRWNWPPYIHRHGSFLVMPPCHVSRPRSRKYTWLAATLWISTYDTNVTYSVEFHKLYKTPSFIVDSISYTFIHSNLLDIRQFYRGNNNLNILFHGNSIFDTNNMRKIQIDITLAHKILDN